MRTLRDLGATVIGLDLGPSDYTTLVGSIFNIWLMANYQLLASGTVHLIAGISELVDSHARPRLHR